MDSIFEPFKLRGVRIPNRVVMAPMSQGAATATGRAGDYHFVHYGARALGGVGLIMLEDSAVTSAGRASAGSLGLYNDTQARALRRIIDFCKSRGSAVGVQIGHAGRKAFSGEPAPARVVGASGKRFAPDSHHPHPLSETEVRGLVARFEAAASRAAACGADVIEIHASHGYLLHEFLSPLTNDRTDRYGGDLRRNARFMRDVVRSVRAAIGEDRVLMVRMPIDDLSPGGLGPADALKVADELLDVGCDVIDAAAGGADKATQFNTHVDFASLARSTRQALGVPTVMAGGISSAKDAAQALSDGTCDLVAIGRLLLENPYWVNGIRATA
jgi:NADPH2 dehydrogenase